MIRVAIPLLALAASLSGCIIYETEEDGDCRGCGFDDTEWTDTGVGATTPGTTPGTTTEPDLTVLPDLWLTDSQGEQGQALLTWIEGSGPVDFTTIVEVSFLGDVTVTQTVLRPDEAMLLIEIDDNAELGQGQVLVEFADGQVVLLDAGFEVLASTTGGGTGGTQSGTGCP